MAQVVPCVLQQHSSSPMQVNCTAAFQDMLAKVDLPPRLGSPPEQMPANMTRDYLMDNQAHLRLMYEGATVSHGRQEPHDWSAAVVEQYKSLARKGDSFVYGPDQTSTIYQALDMYPVDELSGLVVGSQTPWLEGILLVAGRFQPLLCVVLSLLLLPPKHKRLHRVLTQRASGQAQSA